MKPYPNAIDLLIEDHDRVMRLFSSFDSIMHRSIFLKASLSGAACNALTVHLQIEEEIFYPKVFLDVDAAELLSEAFLDHKKIRDLIAQLRQTSPGDEHFQGKVKALREYLERHVNEEESLIFPKVRQSDTNLVALGEQLMERKLELEKSVHYNVATVIANKMDATSL